MEATNEASYKCSYDELVEPYKLVPNPKNPNEHPEKQIEMLAKIIDYQGQRKAIVVSKLSGFIVKGHGTLEALKMLGWEKVAVDYQEYENDAQEYADMKADNEIQSYSKLNKKKDKKNIKELGMEDFDVELMGVEEVLKDVEDFQDEVAKNTEDATEQAKDKEEIGKSRGKILHSCPKCKHKFTTGKDE